MRISNERRRDTEQRVQGAARAMLAGEIPAGGKCDITTLARQAGISRATLYRSYPHLKAEFEAQLAQRQASGSAAAPRPDTASPAHPCDVRHTRDPLSHPKADATAAPQPLRPRAVTAGETRHRYSRTRRVPTKSAAAGSPAW